MGAMAILAVLCWLTLSQVQGDKASGAAVQDNESAASAPRLYRNVPVGVYASAAPYAAYSFHLPQFIAAPRAAASQVTPVHQKPVNQNVQTYLMDSYGNKFAETPQLAPYRAAFPQQYVSLQPKLPEHLAQPLVAASPNFQFKQSAPQVFFGAPYRVPALQSPAPTPLNHFPTFGQLYGEKVQSLAPTSNAHSNAFGRPSAQQQSSNNKAVFANTQSHEQYNNYKNEPTFQRQQQLPQIIVGKPKIQNIQEISHGPHSDAKYQRIQEASHPTHGEVKFQRLQEAPHSNHADVKFQQSQEVSYPTPSEPKFQRIQEAPHAPHGEVKFQRIQEVPHSNNGEAKFQRIQEKPRAEHSEGKFHQQADKPHSSHEHTKYQRIQEIPQEPHGESKIQRLQESPKLVHVEHKYQRQQEGPEHQDVNSHATNSDKAQLEAPSKDTTITYVNNINGKTTVVKVKPRPLPLLDLTLLEPLKFDKPLVPQVQHFLPRISQATYRKLPEFNADGVKNYQKEFVIQKTMSYDSSEKPQKKQKKPTQPVKHGKKNDVPKKTVTYHETLDDAPEIVYEISNSPGHKETIKEKAISYNRETQSEPVHYSYGSKSEKEPVTYSYTRTSKEPEQIKEVHYHGNGPTHLIYNFKPDEQHKEEHVHNAAPQSDDENHKGSSEESESDDSGYHRGQAQHYEEHPKSSAEHHEPAHKEHEHSHRPEKQHESLHASPPKYYSTPGQNNGQHFDFEPMTKEFEEDIRLLASAQIKVDPNQHVNQQQHFKPSAQQHAPTAEHEEQPHEPHRHQQSSLQQHPHPSPVPQTYNHYSTPHTESHNPPAAHVHEKSKRIIIQEEAPDERHTLTEQMKAEVINREENSEEDFEKAYKDAAFGFPAYSKEALEAAEKDIFDPESYGVPPDHVEYDIDHTPFEQYQEEGDDFPKKSRATYKDARDKMKEDYYTDYSISKPESLLDRYQNKLGYYKLYKQQKPDYLVSDSDDDDKKKEKQKFAKYSVAPSFNFAPSKEEKSKSYYGHHKPKQQLYEYDYSKGAPRDSSAFASRPYQRYKSKTNFVEPQFQYGFEPVAIPKLLDSELAAMASNHNPESEKPGMRKKVYKENWYIKKTSTSAGAPAS